MVQTISQIENFNEEVEGSKKKEKSGCAGLGVGYTLISTAAFSLASTLLKKSAAKWHPFTVGVVTFPVATIFFIPFVIYGMITNPKSLKVGLIPWKENKTSLFFVGVRFIFLH